MSKLKEMLEKIEPHIRANFDKDGKFDMPTWFLEDSTSEVKHIVATPFNGNASKDMVVSYMKQHFAEHNIARYLMAAESWYIHRKEKPDADTPPPSQCDDRMEAIVISGADRDTGETLLKVLKIVRTGEKVILEEKPIFSDAQSAGGRFDEIFDKPVRH